MAVFISTMHTQKVVNTAISSIPLEHGLMAVKVEDRTTLKADSGADTVLHETSRELICPEASIEPLSQGETPKLEKRILLFTDAVLEVYRRNQFLYPDDLSEEKYGLSDDDLLAVKQPFSALEKGIEGALVHWYVEGHKLFHPVKDEVYPTMIHLDYMKGHLSNDKYDLVKALEILSDNPDVEVPSGDHPYDSKIRSIPYYNAEEDRNRYISINYYPDHETANRLWQEAKRINPKYPTTSDAEAIDALDALGLIAGGALLETKKEI